MPTSSQRQRQAGPEPNRPPCGLVRRLAIMLYDALAVVALLILATALAMLAGFDQVRAMRDPGFTLYLALVWFAYLAGFWKHGGMTIGMRAWRVKIETRDQGQPGWWRCLLRFLVSLLSAASLGIGFAWSLFDRRKRTWHDMASKTRLVRVPKTGA